jgi:hypothetical protein
MNKVKKLGKTILQQRSELESLFLDALQTVKRQIVYDHLQYRNDDLNVHENRLVHSHHGQRDSTAMRTFNEVNTNGVFHDLEDEAKW